MHAPLRSSAYIWGYGVTNSYMVIYCDVHRFPWWVIFWHSCTLSFVGISNKIELYASFMSASWGNYRHGPSIISREISHCALLSVTSSLNDEWRIFDQISRPYFDSHARGHCSGNNGSLTGNVSRSEILFSLVWYSFYITLSDFWSKSELVVEELNRQT